MNIKELIQILEKKHKSSKGFMGVNFDGLESPSDLFENVRDEIMVITQCLEYDDVTEEYGMSVREAKGYITKLNKFLWIYEGKTK